MGIIVAEVDTLLYEKLKVKVKFTLEQAMNVHRWYKGIILLFLYPRRQMGLGGEHHAPAALPPGKRPVTHCVGGCFGTRIGLDGCGKFRLHRYSHTRAHTQNK